MHNTLAPTPGKFFLHFLTNLQFINSQNYSNDISQNKDQLITKFRNEKKNFSFPLVVTNFNYCIQQAFSCKVGTNPTIRIGNANTSNDEVISKHKMYSTHTITKIL